MLVIIYGLPGVGKTYAGRVLGNVFGYHFWDGDNALPQEMVDCIAQEKQMTLEMVNALTENLIKNIRILKKVVGDKPGDKPIVVSQALFIAANREAIADAFLDAVFIHLQSEAQHVLARLNKRGSGYDEAYLANIAKDFEVSEYTDRNIVVLNNGSREELIQTLGAALRLQPIPSHSEPVIEMYEEDLFRVKTEEVEVKPDLVEWVEKTSLERREDLRVCIATQTHEAYLYFRNNTIQALTCQTRDELMEAIKIATDKSRNKLQREFLEARNNSSWVSEYYEKFFHSNKIFKSLNPDINFSTHLIRTMYSNRKPLQQKTFIRGVLFKQKEPQRVPTILYFPGTAYTRELSQPCQEIAFKLALNTGCNVFMVDYRLAPEKRFPQPLLDAVSAYEYLSKNSHDLGINAQRIIISGYSSGATLAIQLALIVNSGEEFIPPVSLMLIAPTLDFSYIESEEDLFGKKDRFMTGDFFRSVHHVYLQPFMRGGLKKPNISPLFMSHDAMRHLPQTVLFKLENDLLAWQHERFSVVAKEVGANLEVIALPQLDHISWWDSQLPMVFLAAWIKRIHSVSIDVFEASTLAPHVDAILKSFPVSQFSATDVLPFSAVTSEQKQLIDQFYRDFLLQRDELGSVLGDADKYPECVPLQIYVAMVHILSQNAQGIEAGKRFFERLEASATACEREQLLIRAVILGRQNQLHEAIAVYTEVLVQWPEDLLSGLMVEFHCFETGCSEKQLAAWEKIKPYYFDGHKVRDERPLVGHYLAHYGYAFEWAGEFEKTVGYAGQALCVNPLNPWAQHALAHALSNLNELDKGIVLLEQCRGAWSLYGDFVRGHNYFHLALFYLQKNEFDVSFDLYLKHIKRSSSAFPDMVYQQTDMIVFLWCADLVEGLPAKFKKIIGDELDNLYNHIDKTHNELLRAKQLFPFLSLLYVYLSIRAGHLDNAQTLAVEMIIPDQPNEPSWVAASWIAEGLIQFSKENYTGAYKALKLVYERMDIGGSDEQRSAIRKTYEIAHHHYRLEKTKAHKLLLLPPPRPQPVKFEQGYSVPSPKSNIFQGGAK